MILDLAQDLLRERGYNGFSYGQIAGKLDVKPAAIHYYFPSKESLGITLVERERRRFKKVAARFAKEDVWARLDWFLNIYEHYSLGGTRVCYLGALESGYSELPDSIKTEVKSLNKEMLDWLTSLLREACAKNEFAFKGEPEDKAALILGALQGAIQIARVSSPRQLKAVMRQIKAEL